jgi:hypothetical protein
MLFHKICFDTFSLPFAKEGIESKHNKYIKGRAGAGASSGRVPDERE